MLINQARNLASLPYSSLQQIQQSIQHTQQLLGQAQRIAYDVGSDRPGLLHNLWRGFDDCTRPVADRRRPRALAELARRAPGRHAVQAGVVANIDTNRAEMSSLVTASQSATGALQATQAGNQLLALQTQQLADLTAAVAAQGRAQNLEAAQRTAAQEQAREQLRRFLDARHGLPAGQPRGCSSDEGVAAIQGRVRPEADPDGRGVRSCAVAALAFVAAALVAVGEAQPRRAEIDADAVPAWRLQTDPLAADLSPLPRHHCRSSSRSNDTCRRVWAENRRRFFAPHKPAEAR